MSNSIKRNTVRKLAESTSNLLPTSRRCPALAHLPKTPLPHGVTHWHQTPGVPLKLIARGAVGTYIDDTHPVVKGLRSKTRSFQPIKFISPTDSFTVHAGPNAILFEPERKWYPYLDLATEKWKDRIENLKMEQEEYEQGHTQSTLETTGDEGNMTDSSSNYAIDSSEDPSNKQEGSSTEHGELQGEVIPSSNAEAVVERILARRKAVLAKAVPFSLRFATNKAQMGGKPIYAFAVRRRVRDAFRLIINHGATTVDKPHRIQGEEQQEGMRRELIVDLEEAQVRLGSGWVMKDWTYLIFPTMKLYRMPLADLVYELRLALTFIYEKAAESEQAWIDDELGANATGDSWRRIDWTSDRKERKETKPQRMGQSVPKNREGTSKQNRPPSRPPFQKRSNEEQPVTSNSTPPGSPGLSRLSELRERLRKSSQA
ncbi:hypothetical protein FA15DRAFT_752631, partial [Coprinopsis marcescibilis]